MANPAPPIGPMLGSSGVNIMDFCKKFNAKTENKKGKLCPVSINIYEDKSFDFTIKNPTVVSQLLAVANVKKGSKEPNRIKVAKISWDQIKTIANNKMSDLNCFNIKSAISMVAGTAKSIGFEIN